MSKSNTKIFVAILAILIVGLSFIFRKEISQTLIFGSTTGNEAQFVPQPPKKEEKPASAAVKPPHSSGVPATTVPAYTGRDPAEINPAADEVRLFSEEQKQKIYNEIKNNAQAVQENNDYFFGWIQLGLLKKVIGDYVGARDAWEYAGVIRSANSISFANLGELYWRYLPNFPKSESNFKISIKNKPSDPDTYMSLADLYVYSYTAKANLAEGVLLKGIAANPADVNLLKKLAFLYESRQQYAKAIEWWQKVLDKEPDNKDVAAAVESLKKKTGQ